MKIRYVTITGADDSVRPQAVIDRAIKYPFAEWGFLMAENHFGQPRFPSEKWIVEFNFLHGLCGHSFNTSAHLCGSWVKSLVVDGKVTIPGWMFALLKPIGRIQLNFHAEKYPKVSKDFTKALLELQVHIGQKQFIFQFDKVNEKLMYDAIKDGIDAVPLFDESGGTGVLPKEWRAPIDKMLCGYAGGLSPDNIRQQLESIEKVTTSRNEIWIDMETMVRSGDNKQFEISKVSRCLHLSESFMRQTQV